MLNLTLPAEAGLITPQPGEVLMVTNADLREPANVTCWPTQKLFEQRLETALETLGYRLRRAHPVNEQRGHGFISSQKEGSELFAGIDRLSASGCAQRAAAGQQSRADWREGWAVDPQTQGHCRAVRYLLYGDDQRRVPAKSDDRRRDAGRVAVAIGAAG